MFEFCQRLFATTNRRINLRSVTNLVAAASIATAGSVAAQDAAAPIVLVETAETQQIWPSFQHPAQLEALRTASVRPIIRAQVTAVHFIAGALVKEGDLLLELDQTDYLIAVQEAEANLIQAKANSVKADADFLRTEPLVQKGTLPQRDLDYALANKDVAAAQVEIAEARLKKANQDLNYTKVYAPFDGRISAPNFAVGDLFSPGDPTQPGNIGDLVSLDPIYATARVDQSNYFSFLARRLKLENEGITIPPMDLQLVLPGRTIYPLKGQFENWDNTAVASTGTIAGRILFDNPRGELLPGENVTVVGKLVEPLETILVPQRAVSFDQQGHYVWVVDGSNTVNRVNIEVGVRDGANWSVPVGLEDGATVVVEGLQKVREGMTVTPKPFNS